MNPAKVGAVGPHLRAVALAALLAAAPLVGCGAEVGEEPSDALGAADAGPDASAHLDAAANADAAVDADATAIDALEVDATDADAAEPADTLDGDGAAHTRDDAGALDVAADAGPPVPMYTFVSATCGDAPPPGAQLAAAPKAYTGGTCPTLFADSKTHNIIKSNGNERKFVLLAPADIAPGEKLPVLVAWHWLKGKAKSFVDQGELKDAVVQQRFIAIIPESKGDIVIEIPFVKDPFSFPWPILGMTPAARFDEEHVFFDDMLACVAEQLPIDKECVAVTGVSAGALYGAQLVAKRSEHIASFLSLSGGSWSSEPFVNGFLPKLPAISHKLPMLVLWGGGTDSCALLNFQASSKALEGVLDKNNQFLVECVHNCGHGVPPVDPPPGESKFSVLWNFAFSHPFWLEDGASPWAKGLPTGSPDWCAIGSGNATQRKGACGEPGCPL